MTDHDESKLGLELRRRLLGALVLIAIGVIFLPGLLQQTRYQPDRERFQIPQPPDKPVRESSSNHLDEAALRERLALGPPSTAAPAAAEPAQGKGGERISTQTQPILDDQGLSVAWITQLGSFQDEQNAKQLLARAQALGFDSHLQSLPVANGTQHRVFVGPFWRQDQADAAALRLQAELKLEPRVIRYHP